MKMVLVILTIGAWGYLAHLAGKFCGFNQLGHDDDTDPARTKPEVAGKSKG